MFNGGRTFVVIFIAAAIATVVFLAGLKSAPEAGPGGGLSGGNTGPATRPLLVYAAASLRVPLTQAARDFEAETGIRVELQFGSSQAMLSSAELSRRGDLLLLADDGFAAVARSRNLIDETLPLAQQSARVLVAKGNPKSINSIADLHRDGIRISLADPEVTAIGRVVRTRLRETGQWDALAARATVVKPTVVDGANDVKTGAVDAALVWDQMATQYSDLTVLQIDPLTSLTATVPACVLKSTARPADALAFARYLAASDRGAKVFKSAGFAVADDGDVWQRTPELVLYAGSMLRPAVEETIIAFEAREGIRVTRVYNGCGILVGQMKAGAKPDLYFACDPRFMADVKEHFGRPVTISSNRLVIAVPKGNPRGIKSLRDLGAPGLRIGVGHEQQCAMGVITRDTLIAGGVYDAIRKNVVVESPTGDLLVNQMRTGSLDAAIVYVSNLTKAVELEGVAVNDIPCSIVDQPIAIGRTTTHRMLGQRLMDAIGSAQSKERFESWGFKWK